MNKLKINRFFLVLLLPFLAFVTACEDEDSPVANESFSNVRVVHTSYNAPAVDVLVDGNKAISSLGYGASSGYAQLSSGTKNVVVTVAGDNSASVIDANLTLDANKDYTVFAVNSVDMIEAVVAEDNRSVNSNKAKVRFVHASPDAPAVDIKAGNGSGPALFSNAAFKDVASYIDVDAGNYALAVTPAGSTTEVVVLDNVALQNGMVYTVIAKGTLDESDDFPFQVIAVVDNDMGDQTVDLDFLLEANIRVIHTSYDAPAVDVWVDGNTAITNLGYLATSGYAKVRAGTRNIQVTPAGATTPVVINADLTFDPETDYTIYAVDALGSIGAVVSEDDRSVTPGNAKVRFIHASPDAPAVDIKVEDGTGAALFSNTSFKGVNDYIDVAPGTYNLAVTPAGAETEVGILGMVTLDAGTIYTVVATGTLNADDTYTFGVRAFVDNNNGDATADLSFATSEVMVVHAVPDAPEVDLLVNDNVAGQNLPYLNNTDYLSISAGIQNIKVNVAGTMTSVIDADVRFNAYKNYSVYATGDVNNIEPLVIEDDLTKPAAGKAHVRFIHLSPDAPAVDITLTNGTVVFGNNAFKEYTAFTPLDAGTYDLQVRVAGTDNVVLNLDGTVIEDGKIYSVIAKGFVAGSDDQELRANIIVNH
ncbi:MAG: hypothetical protein SCALA702_23990 [Melioribacteraceae bacterium]|nr:MAG: hypothetical protein SCALA702_23990 [Melioribacteraceae bacterium]